MAIAHGSRMLQARIFMGLSRSELRPSEEDFRFGLSFEKMKRYEGCKGFADVVNVC